MTDKRSQQRTFVRLVALFGATNLVELTCLQQSDPRPKISRLVARILGTKGRSYRRLLSELGTYDHTAVRNVLAKRWQPRPRIAPVVAACLQKGSASVLTIIARCQSELKFTPSFAEVKSERKRLRSKLVSPTKLRLKKLERIFTAPPAPVEEVTQPRPVIGPSLHAEIPPILKQYRALERVPGRGPAKIAERFYRKNLKEIQAAQQAHGQMKRMIRVSTPEGALREKIKRYHFYVQGDPVLDDRAYKHLLHNMKYHPTAVGAADMSFGGKCTTVDDLELVLFGWECAFKSPKDQQKPWSRVCNAKNLYGCNADHSRVGWKDPHPREPELLALARAVHERVERLRRLQGKL